MNLVQLLLPVKGNSGSSYGPEVLPAICRALAERFGGVTAYSRSPAKGLWHDGGHVERDDVIEIEVMTESIDRAWWAAFREQLERDLRQKEIVVRCHVIERL